MMDKVVSINTLLAVSVGLLLGLIMGSYLTASKENYHAKFIQHRLDRCEVGRDVCSSNLERLEPQIVKLRKQYYGLFEKKCPNGIK